MPSNNAIFASALVLAGLLCYLVYIVVHVWSVLS